MKWVLVLRCRECEYAEARSLFGYRAFHGGMGVCPGCGAKNGMGKHRGPLFVAARRRWPWSKWEFRKEQ